MLQDNFEFNFNVERDNFLESVDNFLIELCDLTFFAGLGFGWSLAHQKLLFRIDFSRKK